MRYALFSALAVSVVLCLSSCGGGGGGTRTAMMPPPTMPPETTPMPPDDTTDDTMTDDQPPMEEPDFRALLNQIAESATERVGSDIRMSVRVDDQFETFAIGRTCEGPTCTASSVGGIPITLTPEDIETRAEELEEEVTGVQGSVSFDVTLGEQNGVDVATTLVTASAPDLFDGESILTSLDGWLQYSAFVANAIRFTSGDLAGTAMIWADAYGDASGSNPPTTLGNAVWNGAVVGVAPAAGQEYNGEATLTLDANNMDLDVTLSNIWSLDRQDQWPTLSWINVPIENGQFTTEGTENLLDGHFFGPQHEEAAGIFERGELVGAFGAKR